MDGQFDWDSFAAPRTSSPQSIARSSLCDSIEEPANGCDDFATDGGAADGDDDGAAGAADDDADSGLGGPPSPANLCPR